MRPSLAPSESSAMKTAASGVGLRRLFRMTRVSCAVICTGSRQRGGPNSTRRGMSETTNSLSPADAGRILTSVFMLASLRSACLLLAELDGVPQRVDQRLDALRLVHE